MSFARVFSAQANLMQASIITIEVDLSKGLHAFTIVGLPSKVVEESRDRISAAIKNSGFTSPKSKNQKVTISLAPADVRKEGPIFDVPMALTYLHATGDIKFDPAGKIFLGELSLDGAVRPVSGVLPLVREAKQKGFREVFVPKENAREAALVQGISIYGAETLKEIIDHINTTGENSRELKDKALLLQPETKIKNSSSQIGVDFIDVQGQESAKRCLEIAAAGGHNIAMFGPPGTGKTMLAKAFKNLLPELTFDEMLEVTSIYSVAGLLKGDLITTIPFRAPHHTASYPSIVGGGANLRPGEITLAHRGVLFMDEFPEFNRQVIDALREPLEERVVSVSRAKGTISFPAHIILLIALNPCPCGNHGIIGKECICPAHTIARYHQKLSGPIVDRIDLWTEVSAVDHEALSGTKQSGETTEKIRSRVLAARTLQARRYSNHPRGIRTNSEMDVRDLGYFAHFESGALTILNQYATKFDLSGRAHHRVMKIARTIADLANKEMVDAASVLEAFQYRKKNFA